MMSDLDVSLSPEAKEVFNTESVPPPPPPLSLPPLPPTPVESPKNVISEWSPEQLTAPPLIPRFRQLNTTFFVKQDGDGDDENDSEISSDTPGAIVFEVEQKMRDSVKAVQFKEMLLARDKHSREIILQRCVEWLQMPTMRGNSKTLDWFMALSMLKTKDSLENSFLWHTLHETIYASESFKTVISFFESF
jgi:hypothetical protein